MNDQTALLLAQRKSPGVAVLLALLFGGFGLFYASIPGGLLMSIATMAGMLFAMLTLGLGAFILIPIWIISLLWATLATSSYNKRLLRKVGGE